MANQGRHGQGLEVACAYVSKSPRAGSRPCGRSRWHFCGPRQGQRRKGGAFRFFRSGSLRRCTAGSAAWKFAWRARATISKKPSAFATRFSIARWLPSPTPEPCSRNAMRTNTTPFATISWSSTNPWSAWAVAPGSSDPKSSAPIASFCKKPPRKMKASTPRANTTSLLSSPANAIPIASWSLAAPAC